jgi:hypothetical protein
MNKAKQGEISYAWERSMTGDTFGEAKFVALVALVALVAAVVASRKEGNIIRGCSPR